VRIGVDVRDQQTARAMALFSLPVLTSCAPPSSSRKTLTAQPVYDFRCAVR
jgi:hypothetical protein